MRTLKFETTDAVFQFALEDFVMGLKSRVAWHESNELIEFQIAHSQDVVEISQEKKSLLFVALDLLASDEGSLFCKICGKEHQASERVSFPVGAGENPLKTKVGHPGGMLRRLLRRQRRLPLFGGKGYQCPDGHELISVITWRT
jgi:hypothetical protein